MSDDPEKVQVEIEEVPKEEPAAPVEEESATPAPVEEEAAAPVEEEAAAPAPAPVEEEPAAPVEEVVSAQEVTDKVREVLTEVPAPVKSDKERIDELENKVNKLVEILKSSYRQVEIDDNVWNWTMDLMEKRKEVCDL